MAAPDDRTPSDETWVPEAVAARGPAADLLGTRYRLGKLLGRGAIGQVYLARDVLLDVDVAVKIMRPAGRGTERQIRRELLALRVLSVPGVAQLRDDGMHLGQRFLVMDVLPGGPFDRLAARGPWHTWAAQAQALLETLARVHFAGIVHRDLKPANILLDARDQPVITDFGLAQGALVEAVVGTREGTPRYMAPEQARGEPCDARADLYAVGVMFAEMVGDGPVPPEVAAVIAAMRAPEAADRPASAVEVLSAIGADGGRVLGAGLVLPAVADEAALRALFDEPPRSFHHVARDAAAELFARTGGVRERVYAELERWVRAGRCHVVGDRIGMERTAVDRLRWEGSPEAAALAQLGDAGEDRLAAAILAAADGMQARGHNEQAMAVLDVGLAAVDDAGLRSRILEKLVCAALALGDERALRVAQHRAERDGAVALARVAEGARARAQGHFDTATGLLHEPVGGELELWRLSYLVLALGNRDPARTARVLTDGAVRCGDDPVRRARWHSWCGNAAYARGDFAEAMDHGERALALAPPGTALRLVALNNTALACLEGFDLDRVEALAHEANRLARQLRHAHGEALATCLLLSAAYRRGRDEVCDDAWIAAAGAVSPRLQAQYAMIAAAQALRRGDHARAVRQAATAAAGFDRSLPAVAVLARAVGRAAGGPELPEADAARLPEMPDAMRLQATALLVGCGALARPHPGVVEGWVRRWPAPTASLRMDVASLEECLRWLSSPGISSPEDQRPSTPVLKNAS